MVLSLINSIIANLPAACSALANGGQMLYAAICAHPVIAGAVVVGTVVVFTPTIINMAANWIASLRLSWHRFKKSLQLSIEKLEKEFGLDSKCVII